MTCAKCSLVLKLIEEEEEEVVEWEGTIREENDWRLLNPYTSIAEYI